jgi:hypothetical protein
MAVQIVTRVVRHTFLDCSTGYFVIVNGTKSGGEIHSRDEAVATAKGLANTLGGVYNEEVANTNELLVSW